MRPEAARISKLNGITAGFESHSLTFPLGFGPCSNSAVED